MRKHFLGYGVLAVVTIAIGFAPILHAQPVGKVEICHIPPGDPAGFHTITISENALEKHQTKHGDFLGSCADNCDSFCDDGDLCTKASPRCEVEGCGFDPVDCDDGDLCTTDSCASATGCENLPVNCDDSDPCTTDSCASATGCENLPVNCDDNDPCTTDSCAAGTGCENLPVNTDDGNPCTVDVCESDGSISHTSAPEGLPCGEGLLCQSGVCVTPPPACPCWNKDLTTVNGNPFNHATDSLVCDGSAGSGGLTFKSGSLNIENRRLFLSSRSGLPTCSFFHKSGFDGHAGYFGSLTITASQSDACAALLLADPFFCDVR